MSEDATRSEPRRHCSYFGIQFVSSTARSSANSVGGDTGTFVLNRLGGPAMYLSSRKRRGDSEGWGFVVLLLIGIGIYFAVNKDKPNGATRSAPLAPQPLLLRPQCPG